MKDIKWWLHLLIVGWTIGIVVWLAGGISNATALIAVAILLTLAGTIRSLQNGTKLGDTWPAIFASVALVLLALPTAGWICYKIGLTEGDWFMNGLRWITRMVA